MKYLLLALFLASTVNAQDLVPSPDACDFYLHLEIKRPCVTFTNYLVSYAYKYCSLFRELKNDWQPPLQAWVSETALCLQEKLATYEATHTHEDDESYCSGLEKAAFASHAECYTRHGFCNLSPGQQLRVVYHLTNLDLLLKPKPTLRQAISLAIRCVSDRAHSCAIQ